MFEEALKEAENKANEIVAQLPDDCDIETRKKAGGEVWAAFSPAMHEIWRTHSEMWRQLRDARQEAMDKGNLLGE